MKHPPIPPNCDLFWQSEKGNKLWYVRWPQLLHDEKCSTLITMATRTEGILIAAVARCAWMDKSQEIQEDASLQSDLEVAQNAWEISESWRKWGIGEKWE